MVLCLWSNWIFGAALQKKANPGSVVDLKQSSGDAAFSLTPSQISEAAACFRRLEGLGNSPAVIFRHYRTLVKPEATKAFWLLRPASDGKPILFDAQAA